MIFSACHFGQNIHEQFAELDGAIYGSDWYRYDINAQRMIPMILSATQEPPILMAFGNVECTRESFKNVNRLKSKVRIKLFKILIFIQILLIGDQQWIFILHHVPQIQIITKSFWIICGNEPYTS